MLGSVLCLNVVFGSIFPCLSFGASVFHYSVFHYSVFHASVFRASVFRSPKISRETLHFFRCAQLWGNELIKKLNLLPSFPIFFCANSFFSPVKKAWVFGESGLGNKGAYYLKNLIHFPPTI